MPKNNHIFNLQSEPKYRYYFLINNAHEVIQDGKFEFGLISKYVIEEEGNTKLEKNKHKPNYFKILGDDESDDDYDYEDEESEIVPQGNGESNDHGVEKSHIIPRVERVKEMSEAVGFIATQYDYIFNFKNLIPNPKLIINSTPARQRPELMVIESKHNLLSRTELAENDHSKKHDHNQIEILSLNDETVAEAIFKVGHSAHVCAYKRKVNHKEEWVSNINLNINGKSYSELTGQLNEDGIDNAAKIANLFQDYIDQSTGAYALIHFHWARPDQDVHGAKRIVDQFKQQSFKHKSNFEIAKALWEEYDWVGVDGYKIKADSEFYHRVSYALLQLTNGFCHSPEEFERYEQFQKRSIASIQKVDNA